MIFMKVHIDSMCASKHQIIGGGSTVGQNIKRKTTCTFCLKRS